MINVFMTSAVSIHFLTWSLKENFPSKGEGTIVQKRRVIVKIYTTGRCVETKDGNMIVSDK